MATPSIRNLLHIAVLWCLVIAYSTPCISWRLSISTRPLCSGRFHYLRPCEGLGWPQSQHLGSRPSYSFGMKSTSSLFLFGWGESKDEKERKKGEGLDSWLSDPDQGPGTSATESMMEQFKKSQQIGKRTASLMEDLASTTITGSGPGGRVKVFVNGHQRPKGIDIDDNYLREVSPEDLVADITAAMQDAHAKSAEQMQKKMQALYADLSLTAQ